MWARRKIDDAEVARTVRRLKPEEADSLILALALDHHLVTRLTSLVAVDRTPSRPDGARLTRSDLPLNLPAGWDFDKVFGTDAPTDRTAPDTRRAERRDRTRTAELTAEAFRAVAQSALPRAAQPQAKGVPLPATATDAELRMWAGLVLLAGSLMLMMLRRRAGGEPRVSVFAVPSSLVEEGPGGGLSSTPGQRAAPLPTPSPSLPRKRGREHCAARLPKIRQAPFAALVATALFFAGLILCGQGVWIHAKALLAQVLLERAFARSLTSGAIVKPWSWADTWPVAVIELPRIGARVIALEGGTGQALAFGPGHVALTPDAGERGTAVYAAHRDTHFAFLRDARIGDEIRVTRRDGATFRFRMTATSVVHWDASGIDPLAPGQRLVLATCWPIEARTRGPLRYLVHAELVR